MVERAQADDVVNIKEQNKACVVGEKARLAWNLIKAEFGKCLREHLQPQQWRTSEAIQSSNW